MSNRYQAIGLAVFCVMGGAIALIWLNNTSMFSQLNHYTLEVYSG